MRLRDDPKEIRFDLTWGHLSRNGDCSVYVSGSRRIAAQSDDVDNIIRSMRRTEVLLGAEENDPIEQQRYGRVAVPNVAIHIRPP
jgi:hypothetical protein